MLPIGAENSLSQLVVHNKRNAPMSIDIQQAGLSLETEIFNAFVGHNENQKNQRKKHTAKRLFAARRAIEKLREWRELAEYLEDDWLY